MRSVFDVSDLRTAEEAVLKRTQPLELMGRAATGLARTCALLLQRTRGKVYGSRVVLLVGSGNNGGDALFAGAALRNRGAVVTALACAEEMHPDATTALRNSGGRIVDGSSSSAADIVASADLIIDGLLGIGGHGSLRGNSATLADVATHSDAVVVAADLPSGVDADTGKVAGAAVWADVTVTFGALKPGLLLPPGADHAGLLDVVDIGLTDELPAPSLTMLDAGDAVSLQPHPVSSDHKYSQGVVGVAAGSDAYPGAAVLAVGAALLTKPGLVRYSGGATREVIEAWPSAIVSSEPANLVGRSQAWAVGPGLGTDDRAREVLATVLGMDLPTVVDADALTLLAAEPALLSPRTAATVLTPHEREFSRFATSADQGSDLESDRIGTVRSLAMQLNCTVLLKGSTTVIADPQGQVRLNVTGTPWLATGGTGDVLTGVVAAYLSAGLTALDAASLAAFVHGIAGRLAADDAPCTSFDVLSAIPSAIRSLSESSPTRD